MDGHDSLCLTSHAAPVVVGFALTARHHVRVGSLMGWRNLSRRYRGYFIRGVRGGAPVGDG